MLGTSIAGDKEIYDSDGFLASMNISTDFCDNVLYAENYTKCADNTVWYNGKTKSIIYSKLGISDSDFKPGAFTTFRLWISRTLGIYTPTQAPLTIKNTDPFDKIYINKLGDQEIVGMAGEDLLKVSYYNLDTNISKAIDKLAELDTEYNETNDVYVVSPITETAFKYWQDLTSKIRLK